LAVVPGLCLDGGDDIGRGRTRIVFEEDRRADHVAVVDHGDKVACVLSGETQHRVLEIAVVARFAMLVSGERMGQRVQ